MRGSTVIPIRSCLKCGFWDGAELHNCVPDTADQQPPTDAAPVMTPEDDVTCVICHGFLKMRPDFARLRYVCGECGAVNGGIRFHTGLIRELEKQVAFERQCYSEFVDAVAECVGLDGDDRDDANNHPYENLLPFVADMRTALASGALATHDPQTHVAVPRDEMEHAREVARWGIDAAESMATPLHKTLTRWLADGDGR